MEIAPNIHHIPGITANPYLLIDPDGLTLIDAGLPGTSKKILAYMASLGFKPADLKRILITHADYDHIGGLAALKEATGARVYTSQIEAAALRTGKPSRSLGLSNPVLGLLGRLVRAGAAETDEIVAEGQVLPMQGWLTVLETPGHTPGHISFYAGSAGVLFCGDSMVVEKDGTLLPSRPRVTWDAQAVAASVRKQTSLGAHMACSGHGPVATGLTPEKFPQV